MRKLSPSLASVLLAFCAARAGAQTNMVSSVSIGTASTASGTANGVVMVTERIGTAGNQPGSVGNSLAGIQYVAGQIPLNGSPASIAFFALSGAAIPGGAANPATAFTSYGTLTTPTAVTAYTDAASKLTPDTYSALTFAAADLGFGSSNFYMIHHRPGTDYFAEIVPGTGTATLIADLKPMSWTGPTAGGPANVGATGYFGLAWATGILSAGAPYQDQSIYYLRTDSTSGDTMFGVMIPALTGASTDTLDLSNAVGSFGATGYTTLAFSSSSVGNYGTNQFYYLRQDAVTGNTILGRLNPSLIAGTRTISDIANLGGVFATLNFAADATGPAGAWGTSQFYAAGALAPGAQSVSFEAIPDHNVGDVFTITPTASSGLDIDVTVVGGPATIQTTGTSGATPSSLRVFTVTTTAPGIVTLQARQAGQGAVVANMLRQSFNVRGLPGITSASSAPATLGAAFTYTIVATGSPTSYAASGLPAGLALDAATGAITGTPTAAGTSVVTLDATNASGSGSATLTVTVAAAGAVPIITSPGTAPGTVGTPFDVYVIAATGLPTSFTASGLPAGLALGATTGAITGTPTAAGTSVVTVNATNASGTGSATLTITVAGMGGAPVVTSPSSASGAVGTPFVTYTVAATGLPTSYTATGLPPGLTLNLLTGTINGTPTTWGSFVVTIYATNGAGTGATTVDITVLSSRIVNFSARALSGPGSDTLIVGFVTAGDGKNLLVRAIGPSLAAFGITNFIVDPILTLYNSDGSVSATDSGWGSATGGQGEGALIAATAVSVGAFALPNGSMDSALLVTVDGGAHTTGLLTTNGTPGIGLLEIYDVGGNPAARLINVSARMNVAGGDGALIAGLVIAGNAPKTVLIRGVGPGLAEFGVTGLLADPQIAVFSAATQVASNAGWDTGTGESAPAQVVAVSTQVGAFPLAAGSMDSALLVTLAPGAYTVAVTSASNGAGVALVEVYDTQ